MWQLLSGGVAVAPTPEEAGRDAAVKAADAIVAAIENRGTARVIFASAPSQEPTLRALSADRRIDWSRVEGFHMDEYLGLPMDAPQAFGQWLVDRLPAGTHLERINTTADPATEVARYSALLAQAPIDLTCLGIGVNGHIAFNEPHIADFADPDLVRLVVLDDVSRTQQVDEGLFPRLEDVPTRALTLTVPALLSAGTMVATVLGDPKAAAVARALTGPITTACPASILRTHHAAAMFLDPGTAAELHPHAVTTAHQPPNQAPGPE